MNNKPNLDYLIFIPARDNSKRVKNKNMRELNGKPLLQYTLEAALGTKDYAESVLGRTCKIIVSTNSSDIAHFSSKYSGLDIYFRDEKLAQDRVQTDEVCLDILRSIEFKNDYDTTHGIGILLQPTSPSRTAEDIIDCIDYAKKLKSDNEEMSYKPWCVFTAQEADGFYWNSINGYWNSEYNCINNDPRFRLGKQWIKEMNPLMKENGAVYVFPLSNLSLYRTYRMPPYYMWETEPMIDVDTEDDFVLAESKMKAESK